MLFDDAYIHAMVSALLFWRPSCLSPSEVESMTQAPLNMPLSLQYSGLTGRLAFVFSGAALSFTLVDFVRGSCKPGVVLTQTANHNMDQFSKININAHTHAIFLVMTEFWAVRDWNSVCFFSWSMFIVLLYYHSCTVRMSLQLRRLQLAGIRLLALWSQTPRRIDTLGRQWRSAAYIINMS